jgi:phage gp46-like protein
MTISKKTIGLFEQESGIYDIEIDANGDFRNDDSYDTEINISLKTDRRADSSEVQQPELRRGWEGDIVTPLNNYFIGSKWWLNEQRRFDQNTLNDFIGDSRDALQHFIDRGLATRIEVTGSGVSMETLIISVIFYIDDNIVAKYTTQTWKGSIYLKD